MNRRRLPIVVGGTVPHNGSQVALVATDGELDAALVLLAQSLADPRTFADAPQKRTAAVRFRRKLVEARAKIVDLATEEAEAKARQRKQKVCKCDLTNAERASLITCIYCHGHVE